GVDRHLLAQSPAGGGVGRLARARVSAAAVGPEPTAVILPGRPPLQKHLARRVEEEHREGAVQNTPLVRVKLAGGPDRRVTLVHEDDALLRLIHVSPVARGYQISTRSSGGRYIPSPGSTPKASWNSCRLRRTPFTLNSPGEWGSVSRRWRSASSRNSVRQICAHPRKNRWSPVRPPITGASRPPSERR